jgi:hypothetical protein
MLSSPRVQMKRPFAALLLVVLGFALIAGLRLAVPHMFVGASYNEAEQLSRFAGSRAAHVPSTTEISEPALPEAIDPVLYAGDAHYSSAASENTGWIDSAIEPGALLSDSGRRPDVSSSSATNSGDRNNAGASGSASFGTDHLWGASGGMNGIDSRSNGNPSGAPSSLASDRGRTVLGVDDLQILLAVPGNGTAGDFPGDAGLAVVQGETAGAASAVPVSEPPMHSLVLLLLSLLWFIRSRGARDCPSIANEAMRAASLPQ